VAALVVGTSSSSVCKNHSDAVQRISWCAVTATSW